jgi:ADP-ribose pyrophosphatase YjhB (NUDIX family)
MKAGKDYIGLGVGAVIYDGAGRILLLQRAGSLDASRSTVGMWSNPGGEVDFGETAEAAAVREAREELGIEIEIERLIGFSDQILPRAGLHWHLVAFLARIVRGEPRILEPDKFDDLRWFAVGELPANCGLHHVIVPLHDLGWISDDEYRRRMESTAES